MAYLDDWSQNVIQCTSAEASMFSKDMSEVQVLVIRPACTNERMRHAVRVSTAFNGYSSPKTETHTLSGLF